MPELELAVAELERVDVGGLTRGAFVVRGALGAAAICGAGAVGPFVGAALAQAGGGDLAILNFALTLEYLEAAFYVDGMSRGKLSTAVKATVSDFGEQESQHVETLIATIRQMGGRPVAKPAFTFPFTDEKSFLGLAQALEDTGVGAYNGAGPQLRSPDLLGAAGAIVQVEARHAAIIRGLNDAPPAPNAFDAAVAGADVLAKVKPFVR